MRTPANPSELWWIRMDAGSDCDDSGADPAPVGRLETSQFFDARSAGNLIQYVVARLSMGEEDKLDSDLGARLGYAAATGRRAELTDGVNPDFDGDPTANAGYVALIAHCRSMCGDLSALRRIRDQLWVQADFDDGLITASQE